MISPTARIHPTAILSSEVTVADHVDIGPYAILEGNVQIGPHCVIKPQAHLVGNLRLGSHNTIGTGAVIGERPQHLGDAGENTWVEIGDHNVIREHVTIHRGSKATNTTKIGHHNYFMVNSHVGHDCIVGDHCMIANGVLLAGHVQIGDRVFLSGSAGIHQFVRLGRLSFLSGLSAATKDIPPFVISYDRDVVVGVNIVGMKRAGMKTEEISVVRKAFKILYRKGMTVKAGIEQIERELGHYPVIQEMVQFIRESKRGISGSSHYEGNTQSEAA